MTATERAPTLDALKPYPAYKHSGVEWIGNIPQGWDIVRLKTAATIVNARADEKPEHLRYLGLEHIESGTGMLTDAPDPLQVTSIVGLYEPNDVLFGKLRPYLMKVYLADAPGCSSTEIIAFRCNADTSPRFLKFWLLSHGVISTADMLTFGSKMPRVAPEQLANLPFVGVPRPDQDAIAAFLDHETARIDALVREQELLLEDLAEKRQSTITSAVTAGIRPRIAQATDVPWMPLIPQHWRIVRLKHALHGIEQGWSPEGEAREATEDEWAVLKSGCVNRGVFRPEEHKVLSADLTPRPELEVSEGDLLMSRASGSLDLIGSVALVGQVRPRLMLSDKLFRLLPKLPEVRPRFLYYAMNSAYMRMQVRLAVSGAEGLANNIGKGSINNFLLFLPPINDQDDIIAHLDQRLAQIDELVLEVRANIEDMKLLRSTLITAATTGKIDVRDWRPA